MRQNLEDPRLSGNIRMLGTASSRVGFFGAAASGQPASSNQGAVATTAAASFTATQWGYSTSTQANAIVTLVNQLRAVLVTLGLIKGSA